VTTNSATEASVTIESGVMRVTDRVISHGRTVITIEDRIEDVAGRLHAYGASTCLIISGSP
jgi:hypothetical protein